MKRKRMNWAQMVERLAACSKYETLRSTDDNKYRLVVGGVKATLSRQGDDLPIKPHFKIEICGGRVLTCDEIDCLEELIQTKREFEGALAEREYLFGDDVVRLVRASGDDTLETNLVLNKEQTKALSAFSSGVCEVGDAL